MTDLSSIVRGGSIATFTVDAAIGDNLVSARRSGASNAYVAISHVWADGHGNIESNSLPLCFLTDLQNTVDALGLPQSYQGHTSIWMDTICLPRHPVKLRTQAIARLSDVFSKAVGILVIDSYLQSLTSAGMSQIELLARVSLSGWTSRLWTFSEGQLARRIWVQFKDRTVDLLDVLLGLQDQYNSRTDIVQLNGSEYDTSNIYHAAMILVGRKSKDQTDRLPLDLYEMKSALISRHTTWRSDEALCLGAVLGLDLERIAMEDDDKKMLAFWQQVEFVPSALVFTHCSSRLDVNGYRWAPSSMLGGLDVGLATVGLQHSATYSTPTEDGLCITAHALNWATYSNNPLDPYRSNLLELAQQDGNEVMLRNEEGGWYSCIVKEQWHQDPLQSESMLPRPVVLFLDYWQDLEPHDVDNMYEAEEGERENLYDPMRGVFATCRGEHEAHMARVHVLLEISELPKRMRSLLDELAALATIFAVRYLSGGILNPTTHLVEWPSLSLDNSNRLSCQVETWLTQYLSSTALQKLVEDVVSQGSVEVNEVTRLEKCVQYICYFCLVGDWYKVQSSDDWVEWTID